MHSKNITNSTPDHVESEIEIEFNNLDLSEEVRVNLIFKGWKISKPKYNENNTLFKRKYTRTK